MAENKTYGTRAVASPHNHTIYEMLVKSLGLKDSERLDLLRRGLTEQQIMLGQFATKGINTALDTANALGKLVSCGVNLDDVAGFYVDAKGHREIFKVSGLCIPVRDYNGHIASLLIRNDKAKVGKSGKIENKYVPASSAGKPKGNKVHQTTHCPIIRGAAITQESTVARITEGVLKADVATALDDIYCLGQQGLHIHNDLAVILTQLEIDEIRIAVDAGEDKNKDVVKFKVGLIKLAKELGIHFKLEVWDPVYGKGIDDVLKAGHKDKITFATDEEVELLLEQANERDPENGDWVYSVMDQSFINRETHQVFSKGQFADKFQLGEVKVVNQLISNGFPQVDQQTFLPNGEEFVMEDGIRCLNMWVKPTIIPKEGNIQPFLDHINYLFPDDHQRKILLDYLAFCIQFTGIKIMWALVMIGGEGIGKSFLSWLMGTLLGERNVGSPANETLHEPYTDWQQNKCFITIEELWAKGKAELMNKLKPIITQPKTSIRAMHRTAYAAWNRFNLFCFTNFDDPLVLTATDRRWGVIKTISAPKPTEYYDELWKWTEQPQNLQAIMHFFMSRDLSKFNPKAKAPDTQAKADMVDMSLNKYEAFFKRGLTERSWPFNRDILVMSHLRMKNICPQGFDGVSDHKVKAMMEKFGAIQYTKQVTLADKRKCLPWLIGDNKHVLANLNPPEIAKMYESDSTDMKPMTPVDLGEFENNVLGFQEKNPLKDDEPI